MKEDTRKLIRTLSYLSTVGMSMAFSVAIGAGLGYFLDEYFDTRPYLFFVFLGFGIVAAFRNLYLMYNKAKEL
jgi:ATP synthase protein I